MSDPRKPIFEAIKAARGGKPFAEMEVAQIDDLCQRLGVPREGAPPSANVTIPLGGALALLDVSVLRAACPERSEADLEPWLEPIRQACARYEINTIRRLAAFLTTLGHESGFIPGREENLNYSAKRLSEVWPNRFRDGHGKPNALALSIAGNPERIANIVYANRMGNGPPESGDGWRYRGVGPPQLTGLSNHKAFAKAMGMTIDDAEVYIRTLEGGVMAAAWFWEENDINRFADTPGISDETKRINGGVNGLADRQTRFDRVVGRFLELERLS